MNKKDHVLYQTWRNIHARCYRPYATHYHRYGGRGIFVSARWHDFWLFVEDVGERPTSEHTIDRIDNDGPYGPENFRWATRKEQQRTTHWAVWVEIDGNRVRACEIAEKVGVHTNTIVERVRRGLSAQQILSPDRAFTKIKREVAEKAWSKRRAQTHCKRGHEFDEQNTYVSKTGRRACRTCMNAKSQAWRDKIRAQGFDPSKPAALRRTDSP